MKRSQHVISVSDWGVIHFWPLPLLTCHWTEWYAMHVCNASPPSPGHCTPTFWGAMANFCGRIWSHYHPGTTLCEIIRGMPLRSALRRLIRSCQSVDGLSVFNSITDESDAAVATLPDLPATLPDLPAKCWSYGCCMRNKCPYTAYTNAEVHSFSRRESLLAGSHSLGLLRWSNILLLRIKHNTYLLPLTE